MIQIKALLHSLAHKQTGNMVAIVASVIIVFLVQFNLC